MGGNEYSRKVRSKQQTVASGIVFWCLSLLFLGIPSYQVKVFERAFDAQDTINKATWVELYKYEIDVLGLTFVVVSDLSAFLVRLN